MLNRCQGIKHSMNTSIRYAQSSPIHDGVLYVGDKADAASCERLRELGITHIVNATRDIPNTSPNRFEYINVNDDDESTDTLDEAMNFKSAIRKGGRVMIHCRAGVSRSVTFVLLISCNEGMRLREAYSLVESRRNIIRPYLHVRSAVTILNEFGIITYKSSMELSSVVSFSCHTSLFGIYRCQEKG